MSVQLNRMRVVRPAILLLQILVLIAGTVRSASAADAQIQLSGLWTGQIRGPRPIGVAFRFEKKPAGWEGTIYAPIWGERRWPLDVALAENGNVMMKLASGGSETGEFDCQLVADSLRGKYRFGGETFDIALNRGGDSSRLEPRHPQVPAVPSDYRELPVSVQSGNDVLKGVVYLPRGVGRHPACVDVTGSRPNELDLHLPGNLRIQGQTLVYWVLDDFLARNGVIVLRLNSHGFGGSTGRFDETTLDGLSDDVSAAVGFLQRMPEVDGLRIGAVGSSRGGAVASLAASKDPRISFLILCAAPGISGEEIDIEQRAALNAIDNQRRLKEQKLRHADLDVEWWTRFYDADVARSREFDRVVADLVKSGLDPESILKKLAARDPDADDPLLKEAWRWRLERMMTPQERSWLNYDPIPAFRKLQSARVLVLHGELDCRISAGVNVSNIKEALRVAGNRSVTIKTFPKIGHSLVEIPPDDPVGEKDSGLSVAPEVLQVLQAWISENITMASKGP